MVHIGAKIKSVVEQRGITKSELSRRLNMSTTNIHKIFKRESIDTSLLQKLSTELEYNFFGLYSSTPDIASEPLAPYHSVSELQNEINQLRKENSLLQEINQLLKEKLGQ